jgi:hypothetical protein
VSGAASNSPALIIVTFAVNAATLAAPTGLTASGSSTSVGLSWTDNSTGETGFRIQSCTGSGCAGFADLATVGANVTSYSHAGLSGGNTYRYRVRSFNASGSSAYSTAATATTTGAARTITIINNMPTSLSIHDVVRLKLATNVAAFGNADLLSNDLLTSCMPEPAEYISPGRSLTFPQTIGNNYSVWISIGRWELNSFTCPFSSPWIRTTSFVQLGTGALYYVYVIVNATNHTSGNWDYMISGSYLNGTLAVKVTQGSTVLGTIPFIVSTSTPSELLAPKPSALSIPPVR